MNGSWRTVGQGQGTKDLGSWVSGLSLSLTGKYRFKRRSSKSENIRNINSIFLFNRLGIANKQRITCETPQSPDPDAQKVYHLSFALLWEQIFARNLDLRQSDRQQLRIWMWTFQVLILFQSMTGSKQIAHVPYDMPKKHSHVLVDSSDGSSGLSLVWNKSTKAFLKCKPTRTISS